MIAENAARARPAGQGAAERRLIPILVGSLLVVTALAYAGTLSGGFVWDETDWIFPAANRAPTSMVWESLGKRQVGGGLSFAYYRPLLDVTFAMDGKLWGSPPAGFHLTNLLLYLGCVMLAFFLAKELLGNSWAALGTATVFALHPVHVEAVAWVIARADLLAFAGVAAALLVFARVLARGTSWPPLLASGVLFLAALLSKESALVGPGLAFACWALGACGPGASRQQAARALTPLIVALVLYGVLRASALEGAAPPGVERLEPQERWPLVPILFARYVALMLWPHPLNAYYEIPTVSGLSDPQFLLGVGLLGAVLLATGWTIRRAPRIGLGVVWFLLGLLPVLQVVPLKGFIMAERYLFLPSFGFALAVGAAGEALWQRLTNPRPRRAAVACAIGLALLWLYLIMARVPDWVEQTAFYRAMVRTSPNSAFAHNNLGQILVAQGILEEGIQHLESALALRPDMAFAHAGLGIAHWRRGDLPRATAALEAAAHLRPYDPRILGDLAASLGAQARWPEAITILHRLEYLQRGSVEVARRLAAAYAALGDQPRADAYAARATALGSREAEVRRPSP